MQTSCHPSFFFPYFFKNARVFAMSNTDFLKPTVKATTQICAVLKSYFAAHGFSHLCHFSEDGGEGLLLKEISKSYPIPFRVGALVDDLLDFQARHTHERLQTLTFTGGILNRIHGTFTRNDAQRTPIRLTEKEVAILTFLYKSKGSLVSRRDLLAAVWEYAESVETHTLETHIYRLRQKIETDPSKPDILLTEENGYRVD
jgi:hypothetical protein